MNRSRISGWMFCVLASSLGVAACSGSNNNNDAAVIEAGGSDVQDVSVVDTGTDAGSTDTGPGVDVVDVVDASADAGPTDAGSWVDGCFVGRPVQMVEFLNRCTTAERATHTMMSPLISADGGVPALP